MNNKIEIGSAVVECPESRPRKKKSLNAKKILDIEVKGVYSVIKMSEKTDPAGPGN